MAQKFETINKSTMSQLRIAMNSLFAHKISDATSLVASSLLVHIEEQLNRGVLYNIPIVNDIVIVHIDGKNLSLNPIRDNQTIVSLFVWMVNVINELKNSPKFDGNTVTSDFLNSSLKKYQII